MNRYLNSLILSTLFCVNSLFSAVNNSDQWIAYAHNDLRAAIILKEDNVGCCLYHIEQAAEKGLKAYLINCGTSFALTHDLVPLLNSCCRQDHSFEQFSTDIKEINPYSTKSRYPNKSYVEPTTETVNRLITRTNDLLSFISKNM